jgi:hypothetical protein
MAQDSKTPQGSPPNINTCDSLIVGDKCTITLPEKNKTFSGLCIKQGRDSSGSKVLICDSKEFQKYQESTPEKK